MNCGIAKLRDCEILFDGQALVAVENSLTITVANFRNSAFSQSRNSSWYRWRDSNPHCLVSKTSASYLLGYTGVRIAKLRNFEIAEFHLIYKIIVRVEK